MLLVQVELGRALEEAVHNYQPSRHVHTVKEACRMLDAAHGLCPKAQAVASLLLHVGLSAMSSIDVARMASLDSMAVALGSPSARMRFAAGGN